jgi:hypothetical protein
MSAKPIKIVFVKDTSIEACAAAFLSIKSGLIEMVPFDANNAREETAYERVLSDAEPLPKFVFFVGTYWRELKALASRWPSVQITQYNPGEKSADASEYFEGVPNFTITYGYGKTGPATALNSLVQFTGLTGDDFASEIIGHGLVLRLIDDRALLRNQIETQIFFAGLDNYESFDSKLSRFDRFREVFMRKVDLDKLIESGKAILRVQISLARFQAENKVAIDTPRGKLYVASGNVLTELTHSTIKEDIPEEDAMVILIQLNPKMKHMNLSGRGYGAGNVGALLAEHFKNVMPGASARFAAAKPEFDVYDFLGIPKPIQTD